MIQLKEALAQMEQTDANGDKKPFSLQFVTANRSKKTGGRIIDLEQAVLNPAQSNPGGQKAAENGQEKPQKRPNHAQNNTLNIKILSSGKTRKVHKRLITYFNGEKVVY